MKHSKTQQTRRERILSLVTNPWVGALVVALAFTLFLWEKGIWLYQDDIYLAKNVTEAWQHLGRLVSSLQIADYYSTYWGFESTYFNIGRILAYPLYLSLILIFRSGGIAQLIYFMVFFVVSFRVMYSFSGVFAKSAIGQTLAAFFFVSTQFFLYYITLPGFAFAILGFPLFAISMKYFFEHKVRLVSVLGVSVSLYWIFSYQRLFIIYAFFAFIFSLYLVIPRFREWKKLLLLVAIAFATSLPMVVSFLATYQDIIFGRSFNNYQIYYQDNYGPQSYENHLERTLFQIFHFRAPSLSFLDVSRSSYNFVLMALGLILIVFALYLFVKKKQKTLIDYALFVLIVGGLSLSGVAHFVSQDTFIYLTYTALPFLANETSFAKVFALIAFVVAVPLCMKMATRKQKILFAGIMLLYSGLSIYPLFRFTVKQSQIDMSKVPSDIQETFYDQTGFEPLLYYPNSSAPFKDAYGLYFSWAPTPFEISQNPKYRLLMSQNIRLVNVPKANVAANIMKNPESNNARYFGAKDVFVFKDIRDVTGARFDYFQNDKDYVASRDFYAKKLLKSGNFDVERSESFDRYVRKDSRNADYFLYSPSSILQTHISTFFDEEAEISDLKPLILGYDNLVRPQNIFQGSDVVAQNTDVHIDYKFSANNRGVIYAKISGLNPSSPFLLQLNQVYHPQWRLSAIDEKDFNEVTCDGKETFTDTENSQCNYQTNPLDVSSFKLLANKQIWGKHFEGNVIGNSWLISSGEIKDQAKDGVVYVAVYYRRQEWVQLSVVLSGSALILLVLGVAAQELYRLKSKKVPA